MMTHPFMSRLKELAARLWNDPSGSRSIRGRFLRGTVWTVLGGVTTNVLVLVMSMVVARIIGKTLFGALGMIQSTVMTLLVFAGLGQGLTATKYVAEYRNTDRERAGQIAALSIVVAVVAGIACTLLLLALSDVLAQHALKEPTLGPALKIAAAMVLFGTVRNSQAGVLMGLEAFRVLAMINVATSLVTTCLVLAGVWKAGLSGALWGLAVGVAGSVVLGQLAIRRELRRLEIPAHFRGWTRQWRVLFRFSIPCMLSNVLIMPAYWLSYVLLVRGPNGWAEMGAFNAANQWRIALMFLPGLISQIAVPLASEQQGISGTNGAFSVIRSLFVVNIAIACPVFVGLCIFSTVILAGYGPGFSQQWPAFVALQVAAFLQIAQAPAIKFLEATGRMWTNFLLNIGWATAVLLLTFMLAPAGAFGLAAAQALAFALYGSVLFPLMAAYRQRSP